jgi:hypothetical protein
MTPERTIRWAAVLMTAPIVVIFFLIAASKGLNFYNLFVPALPLVPIVCLVVFSSRIAAALLVIVTFAITIAISISFFYALSGHTMHLMVTYIKVLSVFAYWAATTFLMFKAFQAAQEIQRRKRGPDPASVFE